MAAVLGCCAALVLGGCSSDKKAAVPTGTSTTAGVSSSTASTRPPGSSTVRPTASTTTVELPTVPLPCQPIPIPATPVTGPPTTHASLLTNVVEFGNRCIDHVVFDFTAKGTDLPGYSLTYGAPPFVAVASGAPVAVAGSAFVVVKVNPGYGYDFETGRPTYNGPKSVLVAHTNHVRAIVETGDFEGVLTWVIGLDGKRPFSVQATGTPRHQLVVTIS
jgi:hypothetical protein